MAEPTAEELQRAKEYLLKSEDALYELLSGGSRDNAFPEDLIKRGRTMFANLKSNYRQTICGDPNVRAVFTEGKDNQRVMLLIAIADLLGGQGAFALAALIVKEGLDTYCEPIWHVNGR